MNEFNGSVYRFAAPTSGGGKYYAVYEACNVYSDRRFPADAGRLSPEKTVIPRPY